MRIKLVRMLVALAMTLMVPLQGVAGVSAGLCMALGDHQGTTTAHDHGSDHDHGTAHEHHSDASASGQHEHGMGTENPAGEAHCPPCVACCAAAAISSFSQVSIPEAAAGSAIAVIPPSFSGVQPETLDRPPLAL
jgi:ABC-type Zn2+ transport system substrate-binding protein/surface adhesin